MSGFRLGLFSVSGLSGVESISNCSGVFVFWLASFMVLIRIGFPSAFVRVDWRFRVDFRVGMAALACGVRFWLSLLGDGAISSDGVDELPSLFKLLVSFISRLVLRFSGFFRMQTHTTCWLQLVIRTPACFLPHHFCFSFLMAVLVVLVPCRFSRLVSF